MLFSITEPFEIPRVRGNRTVIDRAGLKSFWSRAKDVDGRLLKDAVGCYIISIESGRGTKPWYVGKAVRQCFEDECFTPHKLTTILTLLATRGNGTPYLTLLAKLTPTRRLARRNKGKSCPRDIGFLENYLIGLALRRNRELCNFKQTAFVRKMEVPGILNSGRGQPSRGTQEIKILLGEST